MPACHLSVEARLLQYPTSMAIFDRGVRGWRRVLLARGLGIVGVLAALPAVAGAEETPRPATAAPRQTGYKLAIVGSLSAGTAGWGTELAGVGEIGGRVQVLPWMALGISYVSLNAPNNEGYDSFSFRALELNAGWRPIVGRWFDPFVQVGVLGVVDASGGYMNKESTSRWGLDGIAGIDFVHLPFAVGVHGQYGFTNRPWQLVGLHLEVRL